MQYSYEFKAQAVEKALGRAPGVSFNSVAQSCGIDHSTLRRWVGKFQNHSLEEENMTKEKTPGQWTPEEKLQAVIACESLDEEQLSAWCRENGIYPHHVKRWKAELLKSMSTSRGAGSPPQVKQLREENKSLKKELRRKEKALAEAAALLVLKKKAEQIWGTGEDD